MRSPDLFLDVLVAIRAYAEDNNLPELGEIARRATFEVMDESDQARGDPNYAEIMKTINLAHELDGQ